MNFKLCIMDITISGETDKTNFTVKIGKVKLSSDEKILTAISYDLLKVTFDVEKLPNQLLDLSIFIKNINCGEIDVYVDYNIPKFNNEYVICNPTYNIVAITDNIVKYLKSDIRILTITHNNILCKTQIDGIAEKLKICKMPFQIQIYDLLGFKLINKQMTD